MRCAQRECDTVKRRRERGRGVYRDRESCVCGGGVCAPKHAAPPHQNVWWSVAPPAPRVSRACGVTVATEWSVVRAPAWSCGEQQHAQQATQVCYRSCAGGVRSIFMKPWPIKKHSASISYRCLLCLSRPPRPPVDHYPTPRTGHSARKTLSRLSDSTCSHPRRHWARQPSLLAA